LLKEVAKRLKSSLREHDIVARLGGDEFVVLLPELAEEAHASAVAHKILTTIGRPLVLLGQEFRITASVGITTYPKDGNDEPSLMKNADVAMYQAKAEGKNNFQFYSEELNANSFERLTLESSLRQALERQEFELHYQPKIDFPTGRISGVEALLRWRHQELGMLGPTRFISIAEETGLIVPIGRWVLKNACQQNIAWHREGLPELTMAVNLSARQFNDENLLQDVADILDETGMDAALLELEITESMLMHNVEKAIKTLNGLKQIGVRLAIDDFGTGYSSLSNLKKFPINTIKVDRSFIRDIPGNPEDMGITDAIIAMGRTLSLTVVAEGVETKEQAEFLRQRACDEFQGFYFSKAVQPAEFAKLLRAQEISDAPETSQAGE
jgi:predicted signal transduction protein with EAL and GGDEF domain